MDPRTENDGGSAVDREVDEDERAATQGAPHLFRTATELMLADRPLRADGAGSGALLVIAHPDDECMFFAPTLLGLQRQGVVVHVLCLSKGDFAGLGATRACELRASCEALGVPEDRVLCLDDPQLQDGPASAWPATRIAALVHAHLHARRLSRVVTFDAGGVSGHANHVATYEGVRLLLALTDLAALPVDVSFSRAANLSFSPAACTLPSLGTATAVVSLSSLPAQDSSCAGWRLEPPLAAYALQSTGALRRHLGPWEVAVSLLSTLVSALLSTLLSTLLAPLLATLVCALWRAPHPPPPPQRQPTPEGAQRCCFVTLRPTRAHAAMRAHRSQAPPTPVVFLVAPVPGFTLGAPVSAFTLGAPAP